MDDEELRKLEKEVKKRKRIASEWASQLHDLVEDRLPAAYAELPGISQSPFEACHKWEEAVGRLEAARRTAEAAS